MIKKYSKYVKEMINPFSGEEYKKNITAPWPTPDEKNNEYSHNDDADEEKIVHKEFSYPKSIQKDIENFRNKIHKEENFEYPDTKQRVKSIMTNKLGIYSDYYDIDDSLLVNMNTSLSISRKGLIRIPVKFGRVRGCFVCSRNPLITLEGSPKITDSSFECYETDIENLKFITKNVAGSVYVHDNKKLKSLEGVDGIHCNDFYFNNCNIYELNYDFNNVRETIYGDGSPVWQIIGGLNLTNREKTKFCKNWKKYNPTYKENNIWFIDKEKMDDFYTDMTEEDLPESFYETITYYKIK